MKKKNLFYMFLSIFLIFLILYLSNNINSLDNAMYKVIISIKSDYTTMFMKYITFFGGVYFILFIMIVFFIFSFIKGRIFNIINLIIIGETIINRIIKIIIRRERPSLINMVMENSFSFPSGHTMVAVALYGFIIYLIYKSNLNKKVKFILILILILLINLIMISRIYLGVHYFSDVIAGLFLSLAYLIFIIDILERKKLL